MKNIIVGQSGGPTAVINASLAGVFAAAKAAKIPHIYGMVNGIQGFLEHQFVDLIEQIPTNLELEMLKRTPSAFLGSCRYKLPALTEEALYADIFRRLEALEIGYFFYIGGNDSMDTINKLFEYSKKINSPIKFIGVPKTIDNDLAVTDHTPGYGSAAKYIATALKEIIRDGLVYAHEQITVVEIMGRNAGWLAASAALAKGDDCEGVDLLYLPEVSFDLEAFTERVGQLRQTKKSLVIALSEGIKTASGQYVCELQATKATDAFGHTALSGTAAFLADVLAQKFGCKTRAVELSTLQRCAAHFSALTDVNEAFGAGFFAVNQALKGESGKTVIFVRTNTAPYVLDYQLAATNQIANVEKKIPAEWILPNGAGVTEAFINYARPLIQGELTPIITVGLPRHLVLKR